MRDVTATHMYREAGEAADRVQVDELPTVSAHPAIQSLLMAQSLYRAAATLSVARGLDPDRPPRLEKATETV